MKKEYYNEQKANYIYKQLSSTEIDKVYLPLVVDIMLRRQFEFSLSDELLDRDIATFKKNVKKIESRPLRNDWEGIFDSKSKEIVLNDVCFKGDSIDFEDIYETLAHECFHAMSLEKQGKDDKDDRTFASGKLIDKTGAMEVFTECEADAIVYTRQYDESEKGVYLTNTTGYFEITPYIDLISSTFGVTKNELLSAAVKGETYLDNLLNKSINKTYEFSGKNRIFEGIVINLSFLHAAKAQNNELSAIDANSKIYSFAEEGINERINNISTDSIDEFKKSFETIKLNQKMIEHITGQYEHEKDENVDTKLRIIDEILENQSIENKLELLSNLQNMNDTYEIMQFMEDNNITIDLEQKLKVSNETIQEHNMEYSSNGMEWDNTEIIEYIQEHSQEIGSPKLTRMEKFLARLDKFIEKIFPDKQEEKKLLPGESKSDETTQKSWDLSNWGIDKDEFMQEHAIHMEEYANSIEEQPTIEQPVQEEGFTMHSGHEDGYSRGYD